VVFSLSKPGSCGLKGVDLVKQFNINKNTVSRIRHNRGSKLVN